MPAISYTLTIDGSPATPELLDAIQQIEVEDHAFSTAGDYERSFIKDGKRYHHIIDLSRGEPAIGTSPPAVSAYTRIDTAPAVS